MGLFVVFCSIYSLSTRHFLIKLFMCEFVGGSVCPRVGQPIHIDCSFIAMSFCRLPVKRCSSCKWIYFAGSCQIQNIRKIASCTRQMKGVAVRFMLLLLLLCFGFGLFCCFSFSFFFFALVWVWGCVCVWFFVLFCFVLFCFVLFCFFWGEFFGWVAFCGLFCCFCCCLCVLFFVCLFVILTDTDRAWKGSWKDGIGLKCSL